MRIGLVDDNPSILDFMTTVLEMEGHTVSTYTDGASLLRILLAGSRDRATLPYDLLIVDYLLPGGVSGLDIVIAVRHMAGAERLPILLISGAGEQALGPVKAQFPGLPILRKPFTIDQLLAAIKQAVSQ